MAGLAIMHSVPKNASWVELWWADSNSIELLPQTDDWLDRALGYQRQQNNVLRLAGIAYLASGRLDKATQLYDAEIQGDSLDRFQALVFGLAFYRQGQTDRALQVWHTGDVSGDEVVPTGVHDLALLQRLPIRGTRTYYTIGEYCQRQGQWLEALMAYELAAKPMRDRDGNLTTGDDPLYRMIAFYQSGIIYTELNEWESAAEMMQAALAVRPEVAPSASADHITALSHLYLARMLEQLGGRERALGEAVEAIAVSPTLCDAYSYVLWLLESQTLPLSYEEQEQIDAVLTQARRQLPHDSSIWEQHVRVYCAMGCADLAGRVVMEARRAGMELPQGMSPCCQ
jgi:tetratricopeptide (TPR) repeat protein